jgi:predicted short-subunit dehydrogenase-like oxidoreductase (DUF2520 family)
MKPVLIIGCGAVGGSLGHAIAGSKGHRVIGVHDVITERAETVAAALGVSALVDLALEAVSRVRLVLVAVPGPAIREVAEAAAGAGVARDHQVWLHCDGREPASSLGALDGMVRGIGTLHPACAFPPGVVSPLPPGCGFAVSGNDAATAAAAELARDLGGFPVRVKDTARDAYHAAAVMASNCAVALLAEARDVLSESGVAVEDAERLVVALASSAIGASRERGLAAGLSGPVRRGDAATVKRHLAALAGSPGALDVYQVLSRAALEVARRSPGYPPEAAAAIERALEGSKRS